MKVGEVEKVNDIVENRCAEVLLKEIRPIVDVSTSGAYHTSSYPLCSQYHIKTFPRSIHGSSSGVAFPENCGVSSAVQGAAWAGHALPKEPKAYTPLFYIRRIR